SPGALLAPAVRVTAPGGPAKCPAQAPGVLLAKSARALLEGPASVVSARPTAAPGVAGIPSPAANRPGAGRTGRATTGDDEGSMMQDVVLSPDLVRHLAGIRGLERASHAYLDMIADCARAGYPLACAIELAERAWDRVAAEEQVVAAHARARRRD